MTSLSNDMATLEAVEDSGAEEVTTKLEIEKRNKVPPCSCDARFTPAGSQRSLLRFKKWNALPSRSYLNQRFSISSVQFLDESIFYREVHDISESPEPTVRRWLVTRSD